MGVARRAGSLARHAAWPVTRCAPGWTRERVNGWDYARRLMLGKTSKAPAPFGASSRKGGQKRSATR